MALVHQSTICPLCGRAVGTQEVIVFPPFVRNKRDPLYLFHDAAVHRSCLKAHPLAQSALAAREAVIQQRLAGSPCIVCGKKIENGMDSLIVGLLTSVKESALFEFNYVAVHHSHFEQWNRSRDFRERVSAFMNSAAWQGDKILFDPFPHWFTADGESSSLAARQRVVAAFGPKKKKKGSD